MSEVESRMAFYEAQLERLRTENAQLRRSAQAFGELAERLNQALMIASAARATLPHDAHEEEHQLEHQDRDDCQLEQMPA
jgi:hypothetical protein